MRTSPTVAVVMERCNRLLAIVIDAVDLKHFCQGMNYLLEREYSPDSALKESAAFWVTYLCVS